MKKITVSLAERSYPIYVDRDLLQNASLIKEQLKSRQIFIVTDEHVASLHLPTLLAQLTDFQVNYLILPAGEHTKTLNTVNDIFTALLEKQQDRTTTLCALGGGVIGDMTGFAASYYRRGVGFIQIPTTLLAQVDSAIGGKTGVNHVLGKNMIGTFYQPKCVIIDVNTLKTLPEREYKAGLAEVVKYGLIADAKFFEWLEQNIANVLAREANVLISMIERCCQIKSDFVMRDEYEQNERALLNLGHSFGHAIEAATHYQKWLHGEAVAAGIMMAADLSLRMGYLSIADVSRIKNLLQQFDLPQKPPKSMTHEIFLSFMRQDKKVLAGQLRLILLSSIGKAIISNDYDVQKLHETIMQFT